MINKESFEWKVLDQIGLKEKIRENENARIYIYGAGMVGRNVYKYIKETMPDIIVSNFVTTDIPWKGDRINEVEIIKISQIDLSENNLILLCAKREVRKEMICRVSDLNIKNIIEITAFDDRNEEYYASIDEKLYPLELCNWYKNSTGKELDLEHPKTFNEKIQWMKLYDRDPRKTLLADKYRVREYVKEKIGEKYLIPLLGVWDNADDIDFNILPNSFVLKCNHGSSWNIIVHDKSKLDIEDARRKLNAWLKRNFAFVTGFELQYKDIPPKIIAEEYIGDEYGLLDYKIHLFDGTPKIIQVDIDRYTDHKRNLYTTDWKYLPYSISFPTSSAINIDRPDQLDEMLEIAQQLGQGFPHVRVDLYIKGKKIYFGEMTFSHGSGIERFLPYDFELKMGEWIDTQIY